LSEAGRLWDDTGAPPVGSDDPERKGRRVAIALTRGT
jgi:hypothetical protein